MTTLDPASWILLKRSINNGNQYKIKPQGLLNVQSGKFLEYDEANWKKKIHIMSIGLLFWPKVHEICGHHGNVKNDGYTINIISFSAKNKRTATKILSPLG